MILIFKTNNMKTYIINNIEETLITLGFDSEDCDMITYCAISNSLLLFADRESSTVSVTPSDVDLHYYVIRNEKSVEIVNSVFSDIDEMEKVGYISEI